MFSEFHIKGERITKDKFFELADGFYRIIVGNQKSPVLMRPCFDITEYCPLACDYCYMNSGPWQAKTTIPFSDIKYYTDAFQRHPALKMMELSGGEPLSAPTPYLEKVFDYSAKYNNFIDVHTNGYFLKSPSKTVDIIKILKKYPRNPDGIAAIQLSISSDSRHKTDYEKKFDFAMRTIHDPDLSGKIYPILFVYEQSIADYFKIMQSRKQELGIKVVRRDHNEVLGNNELTFESNGRPFGICDCNFIKVFDSGFAQNDGTWKVFEEPSVALPIALFNAIGYGGRGGIKSTELFFWPDGGAGLLIDLIPVGRVPYKEENGENKTIVRLLNDIAVKLAFQSTDEGSRQLQDSLKERFNIARGQRAAFCARTRNRQI
ncbi:MAG: radical SAM protein [Rickettsiales bacterium]|jgi:organic radical activating enzyme|nr:radical SAM protein [Rickettsiales bacterium]